MKHSSEVSSDTGCQSIYSNNIRSFGDLGRVNFRIRVSLPPDLGPMLSVALPHCTPFTQHAEPIFHLQRQTAASIPVSQPL